MKEYIKLFNDLQSADGYVINDIPFTCTAISGDGTGNINLRCNEEDKKLEVEGDKIEIVDNGIPNDEIWYTSSDGNIVTPYRASALPNIVSNTYVNGKGVIKFATDVTSIGIGAFEDCSGLTSVIIPNSVTNIGLIAFYGCSGLTSINIPNSVTSIIDSAFQGCTSLPVENNLRYADTYLVEAADKALTSYTIKDGTKWIGNSAFWNCYSLTSVTIPNSVTSIGQSAFYGCSGLTFVTIPDSVTNIGDYAFQCGGTGSYTGSLEKIIVGENVFTYDGVSQYFSITLGNGSVIGLMMYYSGGGSND